MQPHASLVSSVQHSVMFIWLFKVAVRVKFNEKVHILIDKLLPYECTVSLFLSWRKLKCIN